MNRQREVVKYIIGDYLSSALAWGLFYLFRKIYIDPVTLGYKIPLTIDQNFYWAMLVIPLFWISIYTLIGTYKSIYRKSRVNELFNTFIVTFIGTVILFFLFLLDDWVKTYEVYRYTFVVLFLLQFLLMYILRFILLTRLKTKLKERLIGFNTIIAGSNENAKKLFVDMEKAKYSQGYKFIGFVTVENKQEPLLEDYLPNLGEYENLPELIAKFDIEEIIIAIDSNEHHTIEKVISVLEDQNVVIKIIPDMYDIITGMVKMNYIFGTALIEIKPSILPAWQKNIKRLLDIFVSFFFLLFFSPLYIFLSVGVLFSSRGPIFFSQIRIGKGSKPFMIYKFRTMYVNAEEAGPQLATDDDPRVTKFGKFLRKYRLDELPQFWNVLKGDMSLVGPRPERHHYIKQIVQVAPHYKHLLKVKPGITSWGQVKFGYAENVDQMVDRLKFDILYIENMSLAMDLKILFYTVLIILQGRGK